MARWFRGAAVAALVAGAAGAAEAHTGVGAVHGFSAGLLHPLAGLDHLLAMVAVGLLAGQAGGRVGLAFPLLFLGSMLAGGALGLGDVAMPWMELAIGASGLVLALMVAAGWRGLLVPALAATAAFGALHGFAHGAELPVGASWTGYAAGFLLTTATLHAAGFGLVVLAKRLVANGAVRWLGGAAALGGLAVLTA